MKYQKVMMGMRNVGSNKNLMTIAYHSFTIHHSPLKYI